MKTVFVLCLLALLTALGACGSAATPTVQPVTETPPPTATAAPTPTEPPPTATAAPTPTEPPTAAPAPTEPPPTERPQLPMVEVSPDHPAALLSLLPDSEMYAYISLDAVAGRPDLEEHVEFQLGHFVSLDELPLAEKLLVSIGADALVLSYPFQFHGWAIILAGDFTRLAEALTMSARAGTGLSVSVVDSHRDIDIYSLLRTKASGYETEIYLAVVDSETLAASPDPDAVRNVVDRHNDGGQLPEGLGALVEDWGLGDFLEAFAIVGTSGQGRPTDSALVYAFHAELGAESTTTFRSLQQFGDETEAAAAAAWLNEQDERRYREIGWGDSVAIDGQWQVEGKTVYGEATVPDEDLPHLVLSQG